MGRQLATRAAQTKNTSKIGSKKLESGMVLRQKRASSPGKLAAPRPKRTALGDVTNQISKRQVVKKPKDKVQGIERMELPEELPEEPMEKDEEVTVAWKDIDKAEKDDPLFSAQYAPEIYEYMRTRERAFKLTSYMSLQEDISPSMRAILVDWLIEVQENFELFHETLYLAVQITDHYLAVTQVKREYLQLVGATAMLIAAKFEELSPPLVDDFLYLCDDAYTRDDLLSMERDILKKLNYDINIPVAYRFLRRLARAAEATMETHTLARYISESTLQEYSFVTECPSYIAAGSMYLALRMKKLGPWTPTLQHYSGYSVEELLPLVERLNKFIQSPLGQTVTVRSKYSHEVFFKVAEIPPLTDVQADATEAQAS